MFNSLVLFLEFLDLLAQILDVLALFLDCFFVLILYIEIVVHRCKRVEAKPWSEGVRLAKSWMIVEVCSISRERSHPWMVWAIVWSKHGIAWMKRVSEPRGVGRWDCSQKGRHVGLRHDDGRLLKIRHPVLALLLLCHVF